MDPGIIEEYWGKGEEFKAEPLESQPFVVNAASGQWSTASLSFNRAHCKACEDMED